MVASKRICLSCKEPIESIAGGRLRCKECATAHRLETTRLWKLVNKARVKMSSREWVDKNREKARDYTRKYRAKKKIAKMVQEKHND